MLRWESGKGGLQDLHRSAVAFTIGALATQLCRSLRDTQARTNDTCKLRVRATV